MTADTIETGTFDKKDMAQALMLVRSNCPKPHTPYRHYKGGLYVVVAVSLDEETLEPLVTYKSVAKGTYWTRTLAKFLENVGTPDCHTPRFAPLVPYTPDGIAHWYRRTGTDLVPVNPAEAVEGETLVEVYYEPHDHKLVPKVVEFVYKKPAPMPAG